MRYISINHVKTDDIIAADIFDNTGRVLVARGMALTESMISRLKEMGYNGVYIGDPVSADIEIPQTISPELKRLAKECIKSVNVEGTIAVSNSIIEEILQKHIMCLDMNDIRSFDDYTYAHSVNVAILSCVIGLAMKLDSTELFKLVNAAILHDFGKMKIPEELINKTSRLTGEEYELVKTHAQESYNILKDHDEIDEDVKQAVLMHHENEDGSGYPRGLTGNQILKIAKIIHVADVYDALVSSRPYKKGYAPWEAAEYLMGGCGICFDREVVDMFIKIVPLYPLGAEVKLSNGKKCVVIANKGANNLRPVVRTLNDMNTIDLAQRENLTLSIYSSDETYLQQSEESRNVMLAEANQKKIVLVDDMKTNLQMLREILEPEYKVIPFKSGAQALKYLEAHPLPDLFILDIDMPEMTGTELAELINTGFEDKAQILFVSALTDLKTVLMCRQLNACGYIARPYNPVYVLSEVKRILEGQVGY